MTLQIQLLKRLIKETIEPLELSIDFTIGLETPENFEQNKIICFIEASPNSSGEAVTGGKFVNKKYKAFFVNYNQEFNNIWLPLIEEKFSKVPGVSTVYLSANPSLHILERLNLNFDYSILNLTD